MDIQLKNLMKNHNNKYSAPGQIIKFRLDNVGITRYLQETSINYTKISYVLCNINKIADLSQKHLSIDYVYSEQQKYPSE